MGLWRSYLRLVAVFLLVTATLNPVYALSVKDLRFGVNNGNTRLVIDLDAQTPYRVFTLSDPYRLVIDMPRFDWAAADIAARPRASVKALRHGHLTPAISRIVFDMDKPIAIKNGFTLSNPDRLVIDYAGVDVAAFTRDKGTVFGTLTEQNALNIAPPAPHKIVDRLIIEKQPLPRVKPAQNVATAPKAAVIRGEKPLIVIDAGHGGVDPGAVGAGKKYEKNAVLALSKALRRQLLDSGKYRVAMTRDSDKFIKLGDRRKFAQKRGADLFISIHADSIDKADVRGASFYTLSNKASDAQTAKLAARENRADLIGGIDLSHEDKDVADILVDLAMRDTMNQSRFFATRLVEAFKARGIKTLKKPHRYAGFAVLKAPDIPSVLVEAGFMSNRKEVALLNTARYREKLAGALKRGIDEYFTQVAENGL